MANAKQLYCQYTEFIGTRVVDKFGGSYQTAELLGGVWRQKIEYRPDIKDFVIAETKLFLRLLPDENLRDLNVCYLLCDKISDYLSKYIAKESAGLTRKIAMKQLMDELFFNFELFRVKFAKRYKKPLDMNDSGWVNANPGVVAMAQVFANVR